MVKDTCSTWKAEDDEASTLKKNLSNGLRRSTREASLKKETSSRPSNTRRYKQLERQMPTKSPEKKKPEKVENANLSSPRRSERSNKFQSSSSSSSKKSEKGSISTKSEKTKKSVEKTKESVKDLMIEASEVDGVGKQDSNADSKRKKRLDARSYRLMLKMHKKQLKESDSTKLSRFIKCSPDNSRTGGNIPEKVQDGEAEGSDCNGKKRREYSSGRGAGVDVALLNFTTKKLVSGTLKNEVHMVSLDSAENNDHTYETCESVGGFSLQVSGNGNLPLPCTVGGDTERNLDIGEGVLVDSSEIEKLQEEELHLASDKKSDDVDLESVHKWMFSKNKRDNVEVVFVESVVVADKDTRSSTADVIPSPPLRCKMNCSSEVCTTCSKRQRAGNSSPMHELICSNEKPVLVPLQDAIKMLKDSTLETQTHTDQNTCASCKLVGKLLCCHGKGCKRCYHPWCLDPPLKDVQPGVWHCPWCVKKKVDFGVHSVSEGVDSIWDVREVELLNSAGVQKQKQYFVKYKGLAHVHNNWIPESQLLDEAPHLIAKYDQEKEISQWKLEWAVPHHLLQKRLLKFPANNDENICHNVAHVSNCQHEWLVKWCGLNYDHVTWELEDASFFKKREGQHVIKEYETRCHKIEETNKGSPKKLSKRLAGSLHGADGNCLNSVNKLRECWHRGQSSVMINEQDRVAKVVYFILSLQSNVSQPFLIITPSNFLSSWEAEFLRIAPSINIVVYSGSRDTRERIRYFEFQECGSLMLEILLSNPEAVSEDLDALNCIRWEAVVLDECQHSDIVAYTNDIEKLTANWKLLLTSIPIKDSVPEYLNISSLLNCGANTDIIDKPKADLGHTINALKERLSPFIVSGCKSDTSRFVEFWVPVQISNVQLEQYCFTLLSKTAALRSCAKNDPVGALRDILLSTRKCCNHPYVVNPALQLSLTKDHPVGDILDIGIRASGKLQLLDAILSELRNRGLRLLILFQSIGSGKDSIEDILDDYLRQRFGPDSYERVDGGGYIPSRKQAALNKFNKEKGRFVFLLETRACLPSIKLSSVDAVIIFDSDWNPLNDLRALQRIKIDSKFEHINIFRFYSFCTIEENILILAKKEMTLDIQSISRGTSHMLLMWGASYLFSKLDVFHCDNALDSSANLVPEDSLLWDVVQEFLSILAKHENVPCKFVSRVQPNGGIYGNTFSLGEQKVQLTIDELPHVFWGKLLDEGPRKWKFSSLSLPRNRKRVRYFYNSPKQLDVHGGENQNKRRKGEGNNVDSSTAKDVADVGRGFGSRKEINGNSGTKTNNNLESTLQSVAYTSQPSYKNSASSSHVVVDDLSAVPEVQMVDSQEERKSCDEQRSLHHLLKPEISKLCNILQLPEDVKKLTEQFLDYVINNHRVRREPETALQAFQISVCWTAASFLDHKIDRGESLVLARENLKFNCMDDEADLIFSKMQFLKKAFLLQYLKDSSPFTNGLAREIEDANCMESALLSVQNIKVKVEERSAGPECSDRQAFPSMLTVEIIRREIFKNVKKVQKKCRKQMERLKQKHLKEVEEFHKLWKEKKARLENEYRLKSAVIRTIHGNLPARTDKLKILDSDYAKKYQELDCQMTISRREIDSRQQSERNEEEQRIAHLLENVKSWAQAELSERLPSLESQDRIEQLHAFGQTRISEISKDASSVSGVSGYQVEQSKTSEVADGDVNILMSKIAAFKLDKQDVSSHNGSIDFSQETNIAGGAISDNPFGTGPSDVQLTNSAAATQISPAVPPETATLGRPGDEVPMELPEAAHKEVMDGGDPNLMLNPNLERERDANCIDFVARSISLDTNWKDGAGTSIPKEPAASQQLPGNSISVQPVANPTDGGSLPEIKGLGDDPSQSVNQMHDSNEPVNEMQNTVRAAETLASNHAKISCDVAADSLANTVSGPTVTTHGHNQQSFNLSSRAVDQPSGYHSSQQRVLLSMQQEHSAADFLNIASSQSLLDLVVHPCATANSTQCDTLLPAARDSPALTESNNHPMEASAPMVSRMCLPSSSDPLQVELERIRREMDQTTKTHEDLVSCIESDCEKEIEEMVTQIRSKYQAKRQEAEASFLLKKRELDTNQNKVLLNKILAEALSSKCIDYRATSALQQATSSSYTLQLPQLLQSATGLPAAGAFPAGPSSICMQSVAPSTCVVRSSAGFPGMPARTLTRPPLISSITPTAGKQQHVASEVHALSPHLQHLRPPALPSSINQSPAVPRALTCQQPASIIPPASSPSTFPQLPLRQPLLQHHRQSWSPL